MSIKVTVVGTTRLSTLVTEKAFEPILKMEEGILKLVRPVPTNRNTKPHFKIMKLGTSEVRCKVPENP